MGFIKWLCKHFKCNSACTYNGNDEYLNNNMMEQRLSNYNLKIKDIKKIYRILGKRETISIEKKEVLNSLV